MDTGVRVSIDGDARDYFEGEKRELLDEAANLLPVIDAWAEQAGNQLMVLSPSSRLTEFNCGAYVRADLADEWRRLQTLDLERWMTPIESAVKAVETKFSIKLHHRVGSSRRMGIVSASNGVSVFDALFEQKGQELDLAIVNAFCYEHAIAERNAGYDTKLPDGTKDYLATRPVAGDERESAARTLGELGQRLKAAYVPYGVSMVLGEQHGWDENRRLLVHQSLFQRLIEDAGNFGPQMKKNEVTRVRFTGLPWDDDKEQKSVNMRVHTAKQKENQEFTFDIAPSTLSTKEKEFMQFLVGRPPR